EVVRLKEEGFRVWDRSLGNYRPLEYRDVAVLGRKWVHLARVAETLQELGVPAVEARGGNLLETPEFTDAYMALRFLAHPGDGEALLRLLHSPFFAVSQREVLELVSHRGKGEGLWEVLGRVPQSPGGLGRAREVLEELLRRRALEAPSRLLQRLDEETGYTGVVARLPRGRRRVRDWEGTLELVRRLEVGAEDPFLVARKLRLLLQGGVQAERPPLEAGNALALLTVHAAKGLEWPVVFVLHVGGWKGNGGLRKDKPLFRPGLALVPPLLDDGEEPSSLFLLAKAALEEEEGAEEERLLYVAATRAGERLYLLLSPEGSSPSPEQGEQDSLWKELREAGAVGVNLEAGPPQPGEATQGEDLPHLLTEGLEGLPLEALPISLLPLAARDPEAARRWLLGEPLEEDLPFPDLAEEVEAEEEAPGGAGVGGMVHALLERLDSAEALDREGRGLLERDFPGAREKEREEALRLARSFLEGEAFAPFREGSVLKEVPV
ncbi:3'-5' exonuclease, partial [Thermus sp.]|uniref:3'-5' exonuclease n=1 Tax=Thermus sp. TaxID=275 RepID=UPI0026345DB7